MPTDKITQDPVQDYKLIPTAPATSHDGQTTNYLHDRQDYQDSSSFSQHLDPNRSDLHLQVRSGEYFATLATSLDKLIDEHDNQTIHDSLDRFVKDLLYMQEHYRIDSK